MLHKIALLAASLTASLVIAAGLAVAGFGPPQQVATDLVQPAAATAEAPATDPPVQVDTVYLAPQATPQQVTVTQVNPATASSGGEAEGGENDD